MSEKLNLTLACGDYEIVRALKEGTVRPDGIALNVLTEMDSTTRHWRFLRNADFDMAEVSCSSYLVARDQGMPIDAIPVFLHRRFRHGFIFINSGKGISKPADLAGKRVGFKQFQATAIVWLRGILAHEYGVDLSSIHWFCELDETIDFTPPANMRITRLSNDKTAEEMLAAGELDAVLHPDLIGPIVRKDPRVGRLFPDYRAAEIAYYRKTGIFPIMHVLGLKRALVERHPWVAINMFHAFQKAKTLAMARMANPRIVPLAWYREEWEEQENVLGSDPWEYGLSEKNRNNIDTVAGYAHEHGLTKQKFDADSMFLNVGQGRKRGEVFRF